MPYRYMFELGLHSLYISKHDKYRFNYILINTSNLIYILNLQFNYIHPIYILDIICILHWILHVYTPI